MWIQIKVSEITDSILIKLWTWMETSIKVYALHPHRAHSYPVGLLTFFSCNQNLALNLYPICISFQVYIISIPTLLRKRRITVFFFPIKTTCIHIHILQKIMIPLNFPHPCLFCYSHSCFIPSVFEIGALSHDNSALHASSTSFNHPVLNF